MKQLIKLSIVAFVSLTLHTPSYSQYGGDDGGSETGPGGDNNQTDTQYAQQVLTNNETSKIVNSISSNNAICLSLPKEYRADCLAQSLREASRVVRKSGYQSANLTMSSSARKIDRLVRQNEDKSAPVIRRGNKTYRAVKKSAVAKVNKQAARIVTEAKTELLRSAGRSAAKKTHYARIAKAVDSTKVLLRS